MTYLKFVTHFSSIPLYNVSSSGETVALRPSAPDFYLMSNFDPAGRLQLLTPRMKLQFLFD